MKALVVALTAVATLAGCNLSDRGCVADTQCREGRVCENFRCTSIGAIADPNANMSEPDCQTDEQCPQDSLCRDGRCDEFQCRDATGTDTSPDCVCSLDLHEFEAGCAHESHCFSGNELIECVDDGTNVSCRCFLSLVETSSFTDTTAAICREFNGIDEKNMLYARCGWDGLP